MIKKIEQLLNDLQSEFKKIEPDKTLDSMINGKNSLRSPLEFGDNIENFFDSLERISDDEIEQFNTCEFPKFWDFSKKYIVQKRKIEDLAKLFQDENNIEILKDIFENYVLINGDKENLNLSDEKLENTIAFFDIIISKIITEKYSREKFISDFSIQFKIKPFVLGYIYDLIELNYDTVFKNYIVEMLTDINSKLDNLYMIRN